MNSDCRLDFGGNFTHDDRPFDVGFGYLTSDGSLLEKITGEFIYVHTDNFIEGIVLGDRCPFCYCHPSGSRFNAEHIIPEWILRFTGVWSETITLPNGQRTPYSRYKVRCCVDCNARMSALYEDKVSRYIKRGYDATRDLLDRHPEIVYQWLSLLFYKIHLQDLQYRQFPDFRKPGIQIGHSFDWPALHHVFCVARSRLYGYTVTPNAIGSIALVKLQDGSGAPAFDYHDHWVTRVMYLRVGEVGLVASLSDAGATREMLKETFEDLSEISDEAGARYLLGEFFAAKLHLHREPKFQSLFDERVRLIVADTASVTWNEKRKEITGLGHAWANPRLFGSYRREDLSLLETARRILNGDLTFVSGEKFVREEVSLDAESLYDSHRKNYSEVEDALSRHVGKVVG